MYIEGGHGIGWLDHKNVLGLFLLFSNNNKQ